VVKALPIRKWTREKETATTVEGESSTPPGGGGGAAAAATVMPQGYGTRTRRPAILECVVCLEDFVEGDVVITLPCHHEFHEVCMYSPPAIPSPFFSFPLHVVDIIRVILPTSVLLAYHIPCVSYSLRIIFLAYQLELTIVHPG
jgi:RING-like zinc finger